MMRSRLEMQGRNPHDFVGLLVVNEVLGLGQPVLVHAIHEELFEREEFEDIFALAREETNSLATFEREGLAPFDDAILSLAAVEAAIQMAAEESPEDYDDGLPDEDEAAPQTIVNPYRDTGRNDPCPCGSGMKFKKCHGAG